MLWEDVLVECSVAGSSLAGAIADVFATDPKAVLVVDKVEDALAVAHEGVKVLVERRGLEGAFALHLSVSLHDAALEQGVRSRDATLATLRRLAARLGCAVLTGDESLDPSRWLLVRGSGPTTAVTLNVERLDDAGFVSLLTRGDSARAPTPAGARARPARSGRTPA